MRFSIWEARKNYTLLITFVSGEHRIYDAYPLLEKGIYSKLKDLTFFLGAKASYGTVIWNDDIDIAPEHLYEHSIPESFVFLVHCNTQNILFLILNFRFIVYFFVITKKQCNTPVNILLM